MEESERRGNSKRAAVAGAILGPVLALGVGVAADADEAVAAPGESGTPDVAETAVATETPEITEVGMVVAAAESDNIGVPGNAGDAPDLGAANAVPHVESGWTVTPPNSPAFVAEPDRTYTVPPETTYGPPPSFNNSESAEPWSLGPGPNEVPAFTLDGPRPGLLVPEQPQPPAEEDSQQPVAPPAEEPPFTMPSLTPEDQSGQLDEGPVISAETAGDIAEAESPQMAEVGMTMAAAEEPGSPLSVQTDRPGSGVAMPNGQRFTTQPGQTYSVPTDTNLTLPGGKPITLDKPGSMKLPDGSKINVTTPENIPMSQLDPEISEEPVESPLDEPEVDEPDMADDQDDFAAVDDAAPDGFSVGEAPEGMSSDPGFAETGIPDAPETSSDVTAVTSDDSLPDGFSVGDAPAGMDEGAESDTDSMSADSSADSDLGDSDVAGSAADAGLTDSTSTGAIGDSETAAGGDDGSLGDGASDSDTSEAGDSSDSSDGTSGSLSSDSDSGDGDGDGDDSSSGSTTSTTSTSTSSGS